MDVTDVAARVEDDRRRHRLHLPSLGDGVAFVPADGERRAVLLREVGDAALLVVDGDADDLDLSGVLLRELLELRERRLAGRAPGRPEVDDGDLALERVVGDFSFAVDGLDREIRRGAAHRQLLPAALAGGSLRIALAAAAARDPAGNREKEGQSERRAKSIEEPCHAASTSPPVHPTGLLART